MHNGLIHEYGMETSHERQQKKKRVQTDEAINWPRVEERKKVPFGNYMTQ